MKRKCESTIEWTAQASFKEENKGNKKPALVKYYADSSTRISTVGSGERTAEVLHGAEHERDHAACAEAEVNGLGCRHLRKGGDDGHG